MARACPPPGERRWFYGGDHLCRCGQVRAVPPEAPPGRGDLLGLGPLGVAYEVDPQGHGPAWRDLFGREGHAGRRERGDLSFSGHVAVSRGSPVMGTCAWQDHASEMIGHFDSIGTPTAVMIGQEFSMYCKSGCRRGSGFFLPWYESAFRGLRE